MGAASIVWYVGYPGQRGHPLRLAGRPRPDDLLLHRAHRLRLRDLLPARAVPAASRTSSSSASGPAIGGAILFYLLIKNGIDLANPANSESGNSWFGVGPPLLIALFFLALGVVLMVVQWRADAGVLPAAAGGRAGRLPRGRATETVAPTGAAEDDVP